MTDPLDHVEQLGAWLRDTDIGLLELRGPGGTLRLLSDGASVRVLDTEDPSPVAAPTIAVRASSPGVFLDRHPLHVQPIASIGADVRAGEPLGFLQIGPLLMAVPAPCAGTLLDVLAVHGAIVGYGEPLFELLPTEGEQR
jgi:acetyl-CoA carboxylase biotin carboxyl carrier protein